MTEIGVYSVKQAFAQESLKLVRRKGTVNIGNLYTVGG